MLRRSTNIILLVGFFIIILFSMGYAQQTTKVGVVNAQEVLEKSTEGKRVIAQLEDKNMKNQNDIAKLDDEIRNLQTKLNTQRLTLTQEAMMNLNSDIERKQTKRKRFAEDSVREMNELSARLFQKVQNELIPIIQQVGKDMNLDVIFDLSQSGTLYFNPTINLTEEVIKRYDASKAAK
ncbi:MAG: OmpH family outer membrane protein [Candidatus Aminicenantes bacterium]|nr:MAG: OmpH family outer membrane protein [Candidatus Aminicenantes bacterium]TET70307.1 MAG: OmpH family outer membrane protein [Candidatus Aminicenantes bacterium]